MTMLIVLVTAILGVRISGGLAELLSSEALPKQDLLPHVVREC